MFRSTHFQNSLRNYVGHMFESPQNTREYSGIITLNEDNGFTFSTLNTLTSEDGMILWRGDDLTSICENEILWHTHNIPRGNMYEPPSGADFAVLLFSGAMIHRLVWHMAIHNNGIWLYRLTRTLNNSQQESINSITATATWLGDTIADIFVNPNSISNYHHQDIETYHIRPMNNVHEYITQVNVSFDGLIEVSFIDFKIRRNSFNVFKLLITLIIIIVILLLV